MSMKSFEDALADYNVKIDAFKKQREALAKQLQISFGEIVKDFFDRYPEFAGIKWTQYTPYFNDGDECTFSRHDFWGFVFPSDNDGGFVQGSIEDNDYPEDATWCIGNGSTWGGPSDEANAYYGHAQLTKLVADYRELVKVLDTIGDEIYREAFGDHVQIVVTRQGVDVEEYEHE
jgi:hypothetical protein